MAVFCFFIHILGLQRVFNYEIWSGSHSTTRSLTIAHKYFMLYVSRSAIGKNIWYDVNGFAILGEYSFCLNTILLLTADIVNKNILKIFITCSQKFL